MLDKSLMKSTMGKWRTKSLFLEWNTPSIDRPPLYTLEKEPRKGYPSAYMVYMAHDTEYEAAIALLGDYEHWKVVAESPTLKPYFDAWREEKAIKQEAMARKVILEKIREGDLKAALSTVEKPKLPKKLGRPATKGEEADDKKAAKIISLAERLNAVDNG
jgi:hypothetical protein